MDDLAFKPSILKWAREKSISLAPQALDSVLAKKWDGMTRDVIEAWESGNTKPSFDEIKKLAEIYRRPLAVFFLDTPPTEYSKPPDKRTIGSKDNQIFSPEGIFIVRKARRVQKVSRELLKEFGEEPSFKYKKIPITANPEELAEKIREDFGIPLSKQFRVKKYADFFEILRASIEATGVITLKTGPGEKLPRGDARAFSFADRLPYLILVNTSDTEGAKNFSLLHEFAHILLREPAVCNDFKSFNNGADRVEAFCNQFAASFLVPKSDLLAHRLLVNKRWIESSEIDTIASQLALDFKVSRFVILRRLLSLKFVDTATYEAKADMWLDENPPKGKGGSFTVRQFLTKNGVRYSSLVMRAYNSNKISHSKVSDYLGFKSKHMKKFERLFK